MNKKDRKKVSNVVAGLFILVSGYFRRNPEQIDKKIRTKLRQNWSGIGCRLQKLNQTKKQGLKLSAKA